MGSSVTACVQAPYTHVHRGPLGHLTLRLHAALAQAWTG